MSVPSGMRADETAIGMLAASFMTAQPPRRSIDETMMFVQMPKKRKVRCAGVPQRTSIISRKVCAFGHLRLTSMARMPKTRTWIEAPEAYQKGPEMP